MVCVCVCREGVCVCVGMGVLCVCVDRVIACVCESGRGLGVWGYVYAEWLCGCAGMENDISELCV